MKKIIDDATYKFILGDISEDQFQKDVEKWKSNGGNKIIEEYEASFKNQNDQKEHPAKQKAGCFH